MQDTACENMGRLPTATDKQLNPFAYTSEMLS